MPAAPLIHPRKAAGESYRAVLGRFVTFGALANIVGGIGVIFGWLLDIDTLKSVRPGLATMKVNTACAFVGVGASLCLLHLSARGSGWSRSGRALAAFAAVLGALSLVEDLFAFDFGIDELIMADETQATQTAHPGRMSPATAICFALTGLALLSLGTRQPRLAACAQWLVVPPLFISVLGIVGYSYGADSLYQMALYTTMALPTAVLFFILALSILAADTAHGFASIATSDTAGGIVSRRLLPTLPVLLFGLGWLLLQGQRAGLYGFEFDLALMVLVSITVCVIAVASTATTLHRIDATRKRGEAEIMTLNADLECRIQERTEQLDTANKALSILSLNDELTQIGNRRSFDKYLDQQIAIARRHQRPLALIFYDVDNFKLYNDAHGHQAGDECLKLVAVALQSSCRRSADMVARYGGEEFAMILPETELVGAAQIAEAARNAVTMLGIRHGRSPASPYVSISGGIAMISGTTDTTAQQLIAAADRNMYQAKRLGGNRIVCPDGEPERGCNPDGGVAA